MCGNIKARYCIKKSMFSWIVDNRSINLFSRSSDVDSDRATDVKKKKKKKRRRQRDSSAEQLSPAAARSRRSSSEERDRQERKRRHEDAKAARRDNSSVSPEKRRRTEQDDGPLPSSHTPPTNGSTHRHLNGYTGTTHPPEPPSENTPISCVGESFMCWMCLLGNGYSQTNGDAHGFSSGFKH